MDAPTYEILEDVVDVPSQSRPSTKGPNPFLDLGTWLKANPGKARPVRVPLDKDEAKSSTIVNRVKRQLAELGIDLDATFKSTMEIGGTKTAPVATFTVWAIGRIVRGSATAADGSPVEPVDQFTNPNAKG